MCGIVGYVGHDQALPFLVDGLRRLEYRGYDSAGVAVLDTRGAVAVHKREGKLGRLIEALADQEPGGSLGIGHTRWATHGPPTTPNAHPHLDCDGQVAVVHNGIVENYSELRTDLIARGHRFSSETDTEVLAHLIEEALRAESPGGECPSDRLAAAVRTAFARAQGAYSVAAFTTSAPDTLIAVRRFSPLVLGLGDNANYLASDIPALLPRTRRVIPLEDDEIALLCPDRVSISTLAGETIEREPLVIDWDAAAAEKGGYTHFVRKEIDEQPRAIADTLRGRLVGEGFQLPELDSLPLGDVKRVYLVAAGTSLYAGLVGKLLLERWARVPVEVSVASELRYGDPVLGKESLVVLITQSGETADTLAAMYLARSAGAPTLAITNVMGSSAARAADATLYLQVGPEIGVVATKTFTGELAVLVMLAADLARRRGAMDAQHTAALAGELRAIPEHVAATLALEPEIAAVARCYASCRSMFFFGRGFGYPIALEGALKLKEISYIHAEGYPAGELKHGPIAMLDPTIPVFAVATASPTYEKVVTNIEEVRARGAEVIALASAGDKRLAEHVSHVFEVPAVRDSLSPFVTVVPMQLFAYHMAVALDRDVDQPRNLAKSVTVE